MPKDAAELVRMNYLQFLDDENTTQQQKRRMFREYYEGAHETQLTTRQKKFLELSSNQEFNLNFCPLVVDALAERLKVIGFTCEDKAELLWEWWQQLRMDAMQVVTHTSALRDGDTYILVDYDEANARPRLTHENAYDGDNGVQIHYSSERRTEPLRAVKQWIIEQGEEATVRRANVYYPDRIEKYEDRTGSWAEFREDDEDWPIPWTTKNGEPLGIPVVHFCNKDQGYSYGESELEDVLPPQNWLNKTALDLVAAADVAAFRIPYMTGGKPENMSFAPGSWAFTTSPDAKVGVVPAGDLSGLISLKESIAADIAKITRTPLSYFQLTGQVAAEGTLKQQEAGLVGKAKDRQVVFGNAWEDVLMMARRIHNRFGAGGLKEDTVIECVWDDPETRNEREFLEGLKLKAELGVPQEAVWGEMGYDADRIATLQELAEAERAREVQGLGRAILDQERAFNAGEGDPEVSGADDADELSKRVESATSLIRAGFDPAGALRVSGLDPVKHLGLLPITVKTKDAAKAEGKKK